MTTTESTKTIAGITNVEPTATDMATAKAELLDALKAALALAEDYQGNSDPGTRERRQGMYATSAIASIIRTIS